MRGSASDSIMAGLLMVQKAILVTLAIVLAACASGTPSAETFAAERMAAAETISQSRIPQSQAEIALSFAPVAKRAAPAVVSIHTRKLVERRFDPFAGHPMFERFFRGMPRSPGFVQRGVEQSLGSGVILDPSGIVVSNYHVVGGADEIIVVLEDGREFQGRVIFADRETDLAVVRLDGATNLPALSLRDSDTVEVGDLVLAIGNPFGVGQTVTSGIISALGRGVAARGEPGMFIQTDAAINPGNSGGALIDMQGRLVGINTAILSRTGGSIGIGFAVPANIVARIVEAARSGRS